MDNTLTATKRGLFYGWWIVAVSTLAMMITNGLSIGGLPVFFKPLLTDLKISDPSVIGGAAALTFVISGLLAPLVGSLIGKVNLRVLMSVGCVCLGVGLFIYSRATAPSHIYIAHVFLGLTLCFASLIPNTVLVSNWFRRMRGTAMGIVITGTSLGGAVIPQIARPLIEAYGWRTAMLAVSTIVWIVLLPAIWLVVRIHPSEKGLHPDGDREAAVTGQTSQAALTGMTLGEALRTPMFYIFSLCAALLFYSILATVQQLNLYLQSPAIGMTLGAAAGIQSTMAVASIGGKFFFGWLSDRVSKTWVNAMCCVLLCGAAALLLQLSPGLALAFAIPFGLGYGGAFVLVQLLVAECFGLKHLGRILGVITVVETIGGALGNYLTGKLAKAGDYSLAFNWVFMATVVALVCALVLIRLVPRKQMA
jgi:MFS family permease